jgi:asparagine synthase (glutamine-hydrolysing)
MQAQSERPVQTFTIGFEEAAYNEAEHARAVAEHLGTNHTELYLTPQSALDLIPRLPELYDEPFADPSQLPTFLVSRLARQDVTVVLSGDGGDELFAGYDRYFSTLRSWERLDGTPLAVRRLRETAFARLAALAWHAESHGWTGAQKLWARGPKFAKKAARTAARDVGELFGRMSGYCREDEGIVLGAREPALILTDRARWPAVAEPLQLMMFLDLTGYMCEDILVKVDRASMGVSLEVRNPLLDHRVVDFAWSLPLDMRVRAGERKWLLRRVLERYVPRAMTDRPKMGFGMPVGEWLSGPLRDWAESLLDARRLHEEGFFEPAAVRRVWEQHLAGWHSRHALLWNLLAFQAWLAARESERKAA